MDDAMTDILTEMQYGSGAVHLVGKMFVRPNRPGQPILLAAVCYRGDGAEHITRPDNRWYERWDGEIVLIPHRKFDGNAAGGMRADQLVCSSLLDNDEAWHEYWKASAT